MCDSLTMGLIQRVCDFGGISQSLVQRQRAPLQTPGQRLPVQQFHHEKIGLLVPADVINNTDVRIVQAGDRLRLALKPGPRLGTVRDVLVQDLDGHRSIEPRIQRFVDLAHSTGADQFDDLVVTQPCAWCY